MKFDTLNLTEDLIKGVREAEFERCTPVQEQSLPECLAGKDIIAQAQTGTGKTAVFLLTIFNKLAAEGKEAGVPRALIMVPTRELAVQVDADAEKLGKYMPYRSLAIYGGVGYEKQETALKEGVDILVATPGRLIDLYKTKRLSLRAIDQFIIDEADRMFDMGFIPDIRYLAGNLPRDLDRQTMLFSATIDSHVHRLALKYMKADPIMVEIEPEQVTVDTIDQKIIYVSNDEKLPVLMGLLKRPDAEIVIVFTNMKITAEEVGWKLAQNGIPASVLTGDINQSRRQRIITMMKNGEIRVLVATDVAARGLHIDNVTHVINYDLPQEAPTYVHRIGRTARAGKKGAAYSLACEDHVLNLPDIEKYLERSIEKEWIDESEMVEDRAGRFIRTRGRKERGSGRNRERGGDGKTGKRVPSSKRPEQRKKGEESPGRKEKPTPKSSKRTVAGPAPGKKPQKKRDKNQVPATVEARLAYYKKKYGEDFQTADGLSTRSTQSSAESKKPKTGEEKKGEKEGVFKKIFKVFGK